MKAQDVYSSGEEKYKESTSEGSECEGREDVYNHEGKLLKIRRTFTNQPILQTESQRENISHTRCKISENVCSLIIDSGSCYNCCSDRLVEKLKLKMIPHPRPYKLHWINDGGI